MVLDAPCRFAVSFDRIHPRTPCSTVNLVVPLKKKRVVCASGSIAGAREALMDIVVVTPIRLFGDGLAACFNNRAGIRAVAVVNDLADLRDELSRGDVRAVLIDVTQGIGLWDVRPLAAEWPDVALVAIGLKEQRQEVIDCGRAGYAGYVSRDTSLDSVCQSLTEIVAGRLVCPPDIAAGLLRALYRETGAANGSAPEKDPELTRRESEVLALLGRAFSNKEIATELCVSVATVKHHVHHVLEKLGLSKRAQAMRRVRDAPWLGSSPISANLRR